MSVTASQRPRTGAESSRGHDGAGYEGAQPDGRADGREASLADLLGGLGDDVTQLFRQEVALARVELQREAVAAGKAAGMLVAGGILAFVTLLLVAWAISWALALALPVWAAFLIVGLVFGAVAGGLLATGRKKLQELDPMPNQTIETLQEDKQVLTDRSPR